MSNNCLVTRLKAVVNDDSLPVIETMQQFTLDAIAASGNNNMTDAQKWALNHFFYSIGAISNSGIYSKLQILGLPFIGTSLNTAIHNYIVGGASPAEIHGSASFSDGIIGSTFPSGTVTVCKYPITGKDNNAFYFVFGAVLYGTKVVGENRNYFAKYVDSLKRAQIVVDPYTEYTSAALNIFTETETPNIIAFNISNSNNVKLCYAIGNNTNIIIPSTLHTGEILGDDISTYSPLADPTTQLKGFAYGSGLTDDEALAFTQAYNTLIQEFNS